nr:putative mitochondrial processing peptidase [Ipomoea batatas]
MILQLKSSLLLHMDGTSPIAEDIGGQEKSRCCNPPKPPCRVAGKVHRYDSIQASIPQLDAAGRGETTAATLLSRRGQGMQGVAAGGSPSSPLLLLFIVRCSPEAREKRKGGVLLWLSRDRHGDSPANTAPNRALPA